eukprot:TRINITY_DN2526_c0_g2_i1.p1 TRINITY_DN2526_c0_g2~~TRINITY_DN2526_c0_g2_i1.p1  ORF type:complete len:208 (+),score=48.24 TRINITY_DN2526_c0_g2_i1:31-624(+)
MSDTTVSGSIKSSNVIRMQALFDFSARVPNELSFNTGDIICVLEKHPSGMWKCRLEDSERVGYCPYNYLSEISSPDSTDSHVVAEIIEPSAVRRNGYMTKQGHFIRNWKKRYFVLRDCVLRYFSHPSEKKPRGTIILMPESEVFVADINVKGELGLSADTNCIVLSAPGQKTYYMYTDTKEEMDAWVDSLRKAIPRE